MICESCKTKLQPVMVICPGCGARVRRGKEEVPWRQQVRETVERHKAKRRREQQRHDDEARQLTIFPEAAELDEEARARRERRAEIRARVEQKISGKTPRRIPASPSAGEVSLRGGAAAARLEEIQTEPEERLVDPTTAEYVPLGDEPEIDSGVEKELDREPPSLADELSAPIVDDRATVAFGLATPGERVLGGFIDLAFVALIQLTLFYLTTHLVAQRLGTLPTSAVVSMALVGVVLGSLYFLFFWGLSGQTLGKLLTGGRVVNGRGRALGFRSAALRLLGLVVAAAPFGAGFLGLWTDPDRRCWHDKMAGSKVVRA